VNLITRASGPRSVAALLVLIAACGGGQAGPTTTPTPPVAGGAGDGAGSADATPGPARPAPGPTAEESLAWVLGVVDGAAVTEADLTARFTKEFLAQVPPAQFLAIAAELHQQLPPVKVLKKDGKAPLELEAILDTKAGGIRVKLAMTAAEPRKIHTLLFQPASTEAPPKSYGEVVAQLQQAGATPSFFIAEVNQKKGQCTSRQAFDAGKRLAIGSTTKLWVLLATEAKLAASRGKLTWDSKLAIRDEAKSLPSGVLQDQPAGTELTVREFAHKMIGISDNTATDHLLAFAGREAVERAMKAAGHGAPALNTPFLSTRELFAVKLLATPEELDGLRRTKGTARRKMLEALGKRPMTLESVKDKIWTEPKLLEFEWFANGGDLCSAMASLGVAGKFDPKSEVLTALAQNPGMPIDRAVFPYVGFKGGSEPGVMNLTYLLQRADGRWFVVVATVNDPAKAVVEGTVVGAVGGAISLLGAEK
jgi:beta-lactamase class A